MTATLETSGERPALRFERHLAHPLQRVWQAIVVPAELGRWFPAAADWTPQAEETFAVGDQTGQITALEAPHLIEWTFAGQVFRFELTTELTTEQDGCALVFTHVFDDRATAAQTAAGWECYFDRLSVHLAGGHHAFTDRDQAALAAAGWDRCFAALDAHLAGQPMSRASSLTLWPAVHERYASTWGIDPEIGRAVYAEHSPA